MRHTRLFVFATVSFAALLSAGVNAQSPKVTHLGVLKPQDSWRVGTVNAQGASYCAMVNKFDKETVLAVARDPDGYGSLALNFADALFTPNMEYQTKLSVGGKNWTYNARASNERALIVQAGQDEAFFKALNGNGAMTIDMAVADATFAMDKFSDTSADLVECAASLKPAAAVADAKEELDSALDSVSGKKPDAPVEMAANETENSLDAIEAEIDDKVKPVEEKAAGKTAEKPAVEKAPEKVAEKAAEKAPEKKPEETKIATAPEPQPALEPAPEPAPSSGRKLLAGMGTASGSGSALASVDTIAPLSAGTVAQQLEQRQVAALQQRAAAEPVKKAEEKPVEVKSEAKAETKAEKETPAFKETLPALPEKSAETEMATKTAAATAETPDLVPMGAGIIPDTQAADTQAADTQLPDAQTLEAATLSAGSSLLATSSEPSLLATPSEPPLLDTPPQEPVTDASLLASNAASAIAETEVAEVPAVPPVMEPAAPVPSASQSRAQRRAAEAEKKQSEARARAKLEAEKTRLAALENLRAAQVMSAEELARQEEIFAQQKKLNELSNEVTSLAAERDSLKRQLEQAMAFNAMTTPEAKQLAEMEASLKKSEQARLDSEAKLKEAYSQKTQNSNEIARMQADLKAREAEAERLKAELAAQSRAQADNAAVSKLKAELAEKDARVDAMRRDLDSRQTAVSTMAKKSEENIARTNAMIAEAQARVDRLSRAESLAADQVIAAQAADTKMAQAADVKMAQTAEAKAMQAANDRLAQSVNARLAPAVSVPPVMSSNAAPGVVAALAAPGVMSQPMLPRAKQPVAPATSQMPPVDDMPDVTTMPVEIEQTADIAPSPEPVVAQAIAPAPEMQVATPQVAPPQMAAQKIPALPKVEPRQPAAPAAKAEVAKPNRAAAFLDRIMSFHRGDAPAPKPVAADKKPWSASGLRPAGEKAGPVAAKIISDVKNRNAQPAVAASAPAPYAESQAKMVDVKSPVNDAANTAADDSFAKVLSAAADVPLDTGAGNPVDAKANAMAATAMPVTDMPDSVAASESASATARAEIKATAVSMPPAMPSTNAPARLDYPVTGQKASAPPPVFSEDVAPAAPVAADQTTAAPVTLTGQASAVSDPVAASVPVSDPVSAPVMAASGPVTLETLLDRSGIRGINVVPVDAEPGAVVRQWSSGRIDGMFEQTGSSGNFDAEVQNYLDRYRQDCPGNLDVKLGDTRATAAGKVAEGAIMCNNPSNGYSTSFVFLQGAEGFSAILHTGYPKDSAMIKSISDNIAHTLSGADGFVAPAPARKSAVAVSQPPVMAPAAIPVTAPISPPPVMPAYNTAPRVQVVAPPPAAPVVAPAAVQPLKFKIRDIPPAADSTRPGEEFGTTVIE